MTLAHGPFLGKAMETLTMFLGSRGLAASQVSPSGIVGSSADTCTVAPTERAGRLLAPKASVGMSMGTRAAARSVLRNAPELRMFKWVSPSGIRGEEVFDS